MTTYDEIQTGNRYRLSRKMRILLFFLVEGVAALVVGFAALFLSFEPGWSAETPQAAVLRPGDARSGSLLLKTEDGYADALRLGIDVDITVSGPTIRARVTQIFRNPTQNWVEATYVYPLPSGGAVDTLKMVVGDRVVVGDIKERQQARAVYEQAKQNGQKAALTEQERPNIFTNSVANIGPNETVLVQIEYQEPVQQSGNEFSLRVPMVVGPRYNPLPVVQSVDLRADGGGWGATTTDPVPDRDRISSPVLDPALNAPINPTNITVRLQAGFPLGEVKSHHHAVKIDSPDSTTRIIKLAEGVVPADRDFELTWKPAAEKAPSVGLFREHVGNADYLLAFVTPPSVEQAAAKAAAARSGLRDRQFRLDGRHLDHPGQGEPALRARPPAAHRPLQRDPLRRHHGRAVSGVRAGRRRAYRYCDVVRRRAASQRRHGNGAGDARGAVRCERRCRVTSARSCS